MELIYLVDDDEKILENIQRILASQGYSIETAKNASEFYAKIKEKPPAVAILDIFLGFNQPDGEELLKNLSENYPNTQCIIISGESDIQKTLSCLRNGALDFLEKPISLARLLTSVRNALNIFNSKQSIQSRFQILGESAAIRQLIPCIKKLASLDESVLILGESGTGKELVAENLHLYSSRYTRSLYRINCTALSPNLIESELFGHKKGSFTGATSDKTGYFKIADHSTLFIDEIGDFDINLQSKILRVLQEKKITPVGDTKEITMDTRLVFATHADLVKLIREKRFREDLYYRISTFVIHLPPLRERLEDIDILASHFLSGFINDNKLAYKEFSISALDKLKEYHYPGNIRELVKIVKNAAFFSENETIQPEDIHFSHNETAEDIWQLTKRMYFKESKYLFERELILKRLELFDNDINKTAESLGMLRNNLYRLFNRYDIDWQE